MICLYISIDILRTHNIMKYKTFIILWYIRVKKQYLNINSNTYIYTKHLIQVLIFYGLFEG